MRCYEALDTNEFQVNPVDNGIEKQTCFKLSGHVREIQFQAETAEECEEWMSVLRNKD